MRRAQILPLHPEDIGLILSYRCQCGCKHCLYNCGPHWHDWISPDELRAALAAIASLEGCAQVHITGGEPFLNFPLTLQAVEIACELDIPRYIETNSGWCNQADLVHQRFSSLRQAGLQAIMISCSPFHAETIPPWRTFMAIDVALQVFGTRRVMIYLPEWLDHIGRFGTSHPVPIERYIQAYGKGPTGLLFWEGYELIAGGRAGYQLGDLIEKRPATAFRNEDCYAEIMYSRHSHMDLYGNYISGFCGGLTLGDWHDLPALQSNFISGIYPYLVSILLTHGPYGLYKMASSDFGYQQLEDGYAGKCHLCVDVRHHLAQFNQFPELRPLQFYQDNSHKALC
jgi:hypothetical protein